MTDNFSRDALYAQAAIIRAHPDFPKAKARHTHVGLDVVDGKPVIAKLACQTSRYATLALILCLYDLSDSGKVRGGVTATTVLAAIGRTPFASRSWAKLMVRVFHRAGMIDYAAESDDRRARPFYPTPALLGMGRQAIGIFFEALAFVMLLPGTPQELAHRPGVLTGMARTLVDTYFAHRFSMLEPTPEMGDLLKRDFGYLIFMHLIQTMTPDATGVVFAAAPLGDMSQRYGVSRASVRNFLDLAEHKGLIVPESKGGHVLRCTPRFIELADHWLSVDLAWFSYLLQTTLQRMGERPAPALAAVG